MSDTALKAMNAAQKIIADMGFEAADADYAREDGQMCLTFYICSPRGITIQDCEDVSRAIEDAVEKADPTEGKPYCLCVSSWGDRPLKTQRDLERNIEKEGEVKIKKSEAKKKKYIGVLKSFDENFIVLETKKETEKIERTNIDVIKPYIGF